MSIFRKGPTPFNVFASSNFLSRDPRAGGEPALTVAACDRLGTNLRAFYADLLASPLPERFIVLLERLDAMEREHVEPQHIDGQHLDPRHLDRRHVDGQQLEARPRREQLH